MSGRKCPKSLPSNSLRLKTNTCKQSTIIKYCTTLCTSVRQCCAVSVLGWELAYKYTQVIIVYCFLGVSLKSRLKSMKKCTRRDSSFCNSQWRKPPAERGGDRMMVGAHKFHQRCLLISLSFCRWYWCKWPISKDRGGQLEGEDTRTRRRAITGKE